MPTRDESLRCRVEPKHEGNVFQQDPIGLLAIDQPENMIHEAGLSARYPSVRPAWLKSWQGKPAVKMSILGSDLICLTSRYSGLGKPLGQDRAAGAQSLKRLRSHARRHASRVQARNSCEETRNPHFLSPTPPMFRIVRFGKAIITLTKPRRLCMNGGIGASHGRNLNSSRRQSPGQCANALRR